MRLTKQSIKRAGGGQRRYLMDSSCPGFGVRVQPRHSSYVVRYRGRTEVIARFDLYSIEEARTLARARMREIDGRLDRGEPPAVTLEDLRQVHIDEHVVPHLSPKTQEEYRRLWGYACGRLGHVRLRDLTRDHVVGLHLSCRAYPYKGNRLLALLSHALGLAEAKGWLMGAGNPTKGVLRFPESSRDRVYSEDELRRIRSAIRELAATGRISQAAGLYVETLAMTGCRPGEPLAWTWDRVDVVEVDEEILGRVRQATAKGDRRGRPRKGRVVWVPGALLEELRSIRSSFWVFPGRRFGEPLSGVQKAWQKIKAAAEIEGTLQAFRHTFRTHAVDVIAPELAGDLLGQRMERITEDYRHSAQSAQARAAAAMARRGK